MNRYFEIDEKDWEDANKAKLTIAVNRISLKISKNCSYDMMKRLTGITEEIETFVDDMKIDKTLRGKFDYNTKDDIFSIDMFFDSKLFALNFKEVIT